MKKKALISIMSKQTESDKIEVVTPGEFFEEDGTFNVQYEETEISGMEGTTTKLKIFNDKFLLIRDGSTTTSMEFENKKDNVALYVTPYGQLQITIETKRLDINIDGNGGSIYVDYNMRVEGQPTLKTNLQIKVQPQ